MRWKTVVAVSLAVLVSGCVTGVKSSFVPGPGQQAAVRAGREAIFSARGATEVLIAPTSRSAAPMERPSLVALIRNRSSVPVTFRYADIAVDLPETGERLHVETVDELQAEQRRQEIAAALILGAVSVGAAAAAANNAGHYHGGGTIRGPYGTTTYTYSGYDPTAAAIASGAVLNAGAGAIGTVSAETERTIAALEESMLMDHTLFPGEVYGGVFVFDRSKKAAADKPQTFRISFRVGADDHRLTLVRTPIKAQ